MSGNHRAVPARRRKSAAPALAALGCAAAAIAVAVVLLRPDGSAAEGGSPAAGAPLAALPAVAEPEIGLPLQVTSTEDFTYRLNAARAGLDDRGHAFVEYVVRNTGEATAPFEAPGQLFLPAEDAGTDSCAEQEGTDPGLCSPPTATEITGLIDPGKPPTVEAGDPYMPAGAVFLVRTTTREPVAASARPSDFRLYVWNVRFIPSRIAREVPLP